VRIGVELGLLHLACWSRQYVAAGGELAHRHARGDGLALTERHRFTIALPLAWRPPSGISCTFSQWILPRFVKKSTYEWRGSDEEVFDDVLFLRLHAHHALARGAGCGYAST